MRKALAAAWAWAVGSGTTGTSAAVDAFIAGHSIRQVAYQFVAAGDWPEKVRQVENELRAHIQAQEESIAELERSLAAALD
jgi:hypothetical protein